MATTPICTDADLEARYGVTNVAAWADLDADASATKITARKLLARTRATSLVYDRLRVSKLDMNLPLATIPDTLVDATVKIAGWWLASARGVTDFDKDGNPISRLYGDFRDAMTTLDRIVVGELELEI